MIPKFILSLLKHKFELAFYKYVISVYKKTLKFTVYSLLIV